MKKWIVTKILIFLSFPFLKLEAQDLRRSVVKIISRNNFYDYNTPNHSPQKRSLEGTGFLVKINGELRVLTNAHVVESPVSIKIRIQSFSFGAVVEYQDHGCDLAVLKLRDRSDSDLFEDLNLGLKPLEFAKMIALVGTQVTIAAFPVLEGGGSKGRNLSPLQRDKGKVTGFLFESYAHGTVSHLVSQIRLFRDAVTVLPGSSGGPVLTADGRVVGIVSEGGASQYCYMIPLPVVQHFLADVALASTQSARTYRGFPEPGLRTYDIADAGTRDLLLGELESSGCRAPKEAGTNSCKRPRGGVQVGYVAPRSDASGVLQKNDVILSAVIKDRRYLVQPGGVVRIENKIDVDAYYLFRMANIGDQLTLQIVRNGKRLEKTLTLKMSTRQMSLELLKHYGTAPTFFIYGYYLFQPLTQNYLNLQRLQNERQALKQLDQQFKNALRHETVVLNRHLEKSRDDNSYGDMVVDAVNGVEVRSLCHLVRLLEEHRDESQTKTMSVELLSAQGFSRTIGISFQGEADEHMERLRKLDILRTRSEDLLECSEEALAIADDHDELIDEDEEGETTDL